MALDDDHQSPVRSGLLAALPPEDLARLRPKLQRVELPFDHIVLPAGGPVESVLFVETGMASLLATLDDGGAGRGRDRGQGGPGRAALGFREQPFAGFGTGGYEGVLTLCKPFDTEKLVEAVEALAPL